MARNSQDYAVVVGINLYPALPPERQLRGAVNDATRFRHWLMSEDGGGLPEANIFPRRGAGFPTVPTLKDLEALLDPLMALSESGEKAVGRRLYLFYSGHGVAKNINDARLLSSEYDVASRRRVDFAVLAYADALAEARVFDQVLVFLDHCRNPHKDLADPYIHWPLRSDEKGGRVLRFYGLATEAFERAREDDWETGTYLGVFTRAVLEGLKGPAASADETITTERLRAFLEWRVPNLCRKKQQTPRFAADDFFDLVSAPPPRETEVTVQLSQPQRGLEVFLPYSIVTPLLKEAPLPPGQNQLVLRLPAPRWYKFAYEMPRSNRKLVDVFIDVPEEGQVASVQF